MKARSMVVVTKGPFSGRRGRASDSLVKDSPRVRVELDGDWEVPYRLFEQTDLRAVEPMEVARVDALVRECAECATEGCSHGASYTRVVGKYWVAVCFYHMIRPDGKVLGGAA